MTVPQTQSEKPLVSIVVPCFNAENTLEKAVKSALNDPYQIIELIIIDDGSTDGTYQVMQKLADSDKRVSVWRQKNLGVSAARNKGISLSKGELIAFLDADDYYIGESLSKRINTLLANDCMELVGAFCPAIMVNIEGKQIFSSAFFDYKLPNNRLSYTSTFGSAFNPSCAVIKKDKLIASGGFNETLSGGEDYELWHRLMRNGDHFFKTDECRIAWTQSTNSTVRSNTLSHYKQCINVFNNIISDNSNIDLNSEGMKIKADKTLLHRAIGTAITSAISGDRNTANMIFQTINNTHFQHCTPSEIINTIKFATMRFLCRPEDEWNDTRDREQKITIDFLKYQVETNTADYGFLSKVISELESDAHKDIQNG